jgi:hypothetical protein
METEATQSRLARFLHSNHVEVRGSTVVIADKSELDALLDTGSLCSNSSDTSALARDNVKNCPRDESIPELFG